MTTLGSRIRFARSAKKLSQDALAKRLSVHRVTVTQWESDTTRPEAQRLPDIARELNTTSDWLLSAVGAPPEMVDGHSNLLGMAAPGLHIIPGSELVLGKDLPVYSGAQGGEGHLVISTDPIDHVRRPTILENVTGGYGLLVKENSMLPAYRDGDLALVNPNLPPSRETDVILYGINPGDETEVEAIIKHLVSFTQTQWVLEQWNPHERFKRYRAEWTMCHRVVGKYNRR